VATTGGMPEPGRAHPALEERRRKVARERGRRRRLVVLGALGAVVCVLAGYWLATGPVLTVNGVTVTGYRGPDGPQLQSALTAAASHGGSLLSPPVDNMTVIAERFPGVQTIHVSRDWPLGLTVTVIPAPAFAIAQAPGQTSVVVSARGLVMAPAPTHLVRPTIVLSQPIPAFAHPLPSWAMQALGFLAIVSPPIRPRIQAITYAGGELRARMTKGPVLILGTLDRLPQKAVALNTILQRVPAKTMASATYLDLSVPDRPALGNGTVPPVSTSTSTTG
jgi:cell division septal protein FtsQ